MYYEINVSLHGVHFFGTHERSLTSRAHALDVYRLLVERFPSTEGFAVDVSFHEITHRIVTAQFLRDAAENEPSTGRKPR